MLKVGNTVVLNSNNLTVNKIIKGKNKTVSVGAKGDIFTIIKIAKYCDLVTIMDSKKIRFKIPNTILSKNFVFIS